MRSASLSPFAATAEDRIALVISTMLASAVPGELGRFAKT